jgi:tetratricopeptide (TPR) repeat protein
MATRVRASGPVVISAIDGMGGIGKSALAIHAAHQLADWFPDGQLYVNLQGATPGAAPLGPLEALGRMLRALGLDSAETPTDLEEASARFRSLAADRRLLLVLDNAHNAEQVRPLLPGSRTCGALVTSRQVLTTLDGAHAVHLDILPAEAALELLGQIAGHQRVAAEPQAAARLLTWCGYLPLAIRIAGARLAARPTWPVWLLADRLADATRRLEELQIGDLAVRASFTVGHQALSSSGDPDQETAAHLFRLLGLLDGPDFGVQVAAALAGQLTAVAEAALERLVDVQLLQVGPLGRYRFHDLLRLFARERALAEEPRPEREAALNRALAWLLATARQADRLVRPGRLGVDASDAHALSFDDQDQALAWFDAERANLVAAVEQAAATPAISAHVPGQLTEALTGFFYLRAHWSDWQRLSEVTLAHARVHDDLAGQARAHNDLATLAGRRFRMEETLAHLRSSLALHRQLGDRRGQAAAANNLGILHVDRHDYDQAAACYQESLALVTQLGDRYFQAVALNNLSDVYREQSRHDDAAACARRSLALSCEVGDRRLEGMALNNLGDVHCRQGRHDDAVTCYERSLDLLRQVGDQHGEGLDLDGLGEVHRLRGQQAAAVSYYEQSLAALRQVGELHDEAHTLWHLSLALDPSGRQAQSVACLRQALAIFDQLNAPEAESIRALLAAAPFA